MSDDLTLAFLGAPRTGTTSLWRSFSKHEEISVSILKEPWNMMNYDNLLYMSNSVDYYKERFYNNYKAKILLDGTPSAYFNYYSFIKNIKLPIKIIYPIRNPFDRFYSTIKLNIVINSLSTIKKRNKPKFIEGKFKVNYNELMNYIRNRTDMIYLDHAYNITDDVFIIRFDSVIENLNPLFHYLNVKNTNIKMEKINTMDGWYKEEFDKIREELHYFWNENLKNIAKIIIDDLYKIKDHVYVEDWIVEAENILSDV